MQKYAYVSAFLLLFQLYVLLKEANQQVGLWSLGPFSSGSKLFGLGFSNEKEFHLYSNHTTQKTTHV